MVEGRRLDGALCLSCVTAGQDDDLGLLGDVALFHQRGDVDVDLELKLAAVRVADSCRMRAALSSFHPSGGEAQSQMKTP